MFEVSAKSHFSSAHHLRGYHGKCEAHHGHNWEVEVFVRGEQTDKTGILLDFRQLKDCLGDLLKSLDHADLNKLSAFRKNNPTSENIARHIFAELSRSLNCSACKVHRVTVHETPGTCATYWEDAQQRVMSAEQEA